MHDHVDRMSLFDQQCDGVGQRLPRGTRLRALRERRAGRQTLRRTSSQIVFPWAARYYGLAHHTLMPDDPHEIVTLMHDQLDELEQKILVDGMNAQEQAGRGLHWSLDREHPALNATGDAAPLAGAAHLARCAYGTAWPDPASVRAKCHG